MKVEYFDGAFVRLSCGHLIWCKDYTLKLDETWVDDKDCPICNRGIKD